ncbi:hypothetical protein [Microcystis phage Mwe-JY08]
MTDAPGLEKRRRADGSIRCYWRAAKKYAAAGYQPTIVPLVGDWNDLGQRARIVDQANRLQREMLQQIDGAPRPTKTPGTIAALCDLYQTHEDSPYHSRRADTRSFYDVQIRLLVETVGARLAREVIGPDVRRWVKNWSAPKRDGQPRTRRAKAAIQTLKVVTSFGVEMKHPGARDLQEVLSAVKIENAPPRTSAMTAAHAAAICEKAREMGYPSIARAVSLQFWTMLRQKDVLGEWVNDPASTSSIRDGLYRWQMGLLWGEHLDPATLKLRKPTSKSNGRTTVEHDLRETPACAAEFADVPAAARIGPVIIDEATGLPWTRNRFGKVFRKIREAAGVPADVWNMDARSGGVTDAFNNGADPVAVMKAAGHTQMTTTFRYNRGAEVQSIAVARARMKGKRE